MEPHVETLDVSNSAAAQAVQHDNTVVAPDVLAKRATQ